MRRFQIRNREFFCKMKSIAVLITVHNRRQKTLECLSSLFQSKVDDADLSVYLVDDGSDDGTTAAVSKEFPFVKIIEGQGDLFWNRGMRLAWEFAAKNGHDYYLWLNDDTLLMRDALVRLLSNSEKCKNASIIVGSTCSSKDDTTLSYGGRTKERNHPLIRPDEHLMKECDVFNGNIVLIPHSVFERVGFNDDYYRHSFGDFDYGIVASTKGVKSYIASGYYGFCGRNNPIPLFRRKCFSVFKRYRLLYSPLGYNPIEDFHFNKKFRPLGLCVWYFIKLHLNVLFPVEHVGE